MLNDGIDVKDDIRLLSRMRAGDRAAFESIYNRYWSRLYIYAYNILRERHAAEDAVQEVMVSLWMKQSSLEVDSLNAFLHAAVRFQVLKVIRSGKIRSGFFADSEPVVADSETERVIHEKDINSIVDRHISELPAKCREIFHLSRRGQLSNKEIADQLGIAQKTVENQITIALRRLRSSLGDILLYLLLFRILM